MWNPGLSKIKTIKLLSVEDNLGDAIIIRELLREDPANQYEIIVADTLGKVKTIVGKHVFDGVLLDLNLPDSSGLDTLKSLQSFFPETPIIVFTGLEDEITAQKAVQEGAQDYLVKNNITTDLLTHAVKYAIDRQIFSRKLAQTQLQYQLLIEKNSDGILVIDTDGVIRYVNPAAEILLQQSHSELVGQIFESQISTDLAATEVSLLQKGGKTITADMRVSEIIWENQPCHLASLRDISDRIELEQKNLEYSRMLKKANQDKDKFFSIIAHDLKSPFNTIIGFSDLLMEQIKEKDYDGIEKYAKTIADSSNRAMGLLMNLMEWASSRSGRMEFKPEIFEMVAFIHEISLLYHDVARQKSIALKKQLPPCVNIKADQAMIATVFRNLISNAIKFSWPGSEILISAKVQKNELLVSVKDTGVGISKASLNKIFNFTESYSTTGTQKEKGTGLGLVLCKEFIEKHGGKIWAESQEGKGSTFYFTLPYSLEHQEKSTPQITALETDEAINKHPVDAGLKILIAEDDNTSAMLLSEIVKPVASNILFAEDGVEALEVFMKNPGIDLVLMDLKMPKKSGFEATHEIRRSNKKVCIIAQTAYGLSDEEQRAMEAGFNAFINKPIRSAKLMALIRKHFSN